MGNLPDSCAELGVKKIASPSPPGESCPKSATRGKAAISEIVRAADSHYTAVVKWLFEKKARRDRRIKQSPPPGGIDRRKSRVNYYA